MMVSGGWCVRSRSNGDDGHCYLSASDSLNTSVSRRHRFALEERKIRGSHARLGFSLALPDSLDITVQTLTKPYARNHVVRRENASRSFMFLDSLLSCRVGRQRARCCHVESYLYHIVDRG
jgi:hypothetical protein